MNNGPTLIEFRDRKWNGWPVRASLSCYGCKHLIVGEYGNSLCSHPKMLGKYKVPQAINNGHDWKLLVAAWQCPESYSVEQPLANPIDRPPHYWPNHHDLHCVRHAVTWTSGWGTHVLEDRLVEIRNGGAQ